MTLKQFKPLLKRLKLEVAEEAAKRNSDACPRLKNIHPFPARMGMEIAWDALKEFEQERRPVARKPK